MGKVYNSLLELIGNTPLLKLNNFKWKSLKANLFLKLEFFNPFSSVKDRAAFFMILEAEKKGVLKSGATIIEPTSGNTGIGLAWISLIKGYKLILTMPENMSEERKKLLKTLGVELILTEKEKGMKGAVEKAKELLSKIPNSFMPSQFENLDNLKAHFETTGPEIWNDLGGKVDILIAGVGTGGTISGTAKFLKEKNDKIEIYGVEPLESPVITKGYSSSHQIQGIGAGFIPSILDLSLIDKVIPVSYQEAKVAAQMLLEKEGILAGISSGAALSAALNLASLDKYQNKNLVVILPDTGERYLSTSFFS